MKTMRLSRDSQSLAKCARELDKEIVILTDRNKPIAALVPLKHVDRESIALSAHPEFLEIIAHARREFAAGKVLSFDAMKRAVLPARAADKPTARKRKVRPR
ncbi:MAG: hypothetical protein HY706_20920 [Candidatus Hydrogenedentes bacterium]|nr:hypothetical protein [Candidatus Hydrogenedentota bacterium]